MEQVEYRVLKDCVSEAEAEKIVRERMKGYAIERAKGDAQYHTFICKKLDKGDEYEDAPE